MFVQRENGKVVGLFELPQPGYAEEEIAADHADVVAFLTPVPTSVSRRQLLLALAQMGLITGEEAVASNVAVPAGVQAVLDNMEPAEKQVAEITWLNFTEALRNDPLVAALAAANDMSSGDVDDFFRLAASL